MGHAALMDYQAFLESKKHHVSDTGISVMPEAVHPKKYDTLLKLCDLLKRDNPKFNPDLFLDAAGA